MIEDVVNYAQTNYIKIISHKFVQAVFIAVRLAEIGSLMIVFPVKMVIIYIIIHVMKYALRELGHSNLQQIPLANIVKKHASNVLDH